MTEPQPMESHMPGPPPTPTSILAARGSKLARGRTGELQPPKTVPKCPTHLSEAAKREWRRMVKILHPVGLLTSIDGDQLALYCVSYARWVEAEAKLAAEGLVVKAPSGYPVQNPYLPIAHSAMQQMAAHLSKFGMNPADRSKVRLTDAPEKKSTLADFRLTPTLRIAP